MTCLQCAVYRVARMAELDLVEVLEAQVEALVEALDEVMFEPDPDEMRRIAAIALRKGGRE